MFRDNIWRLHGLPDSIISDRGPQFAAGLMRELNELLVITPGYIEEYSEELDDEGRLRNNKYLHYEVTDEKHDRMGEMCDPYEGL